MRRRLGVLGLVIAALLALWWWHGSREANLPDGASKPAATAVSRTETARAKTAVLHGKVTRAKDGAPVAGVYVAIAPTEDPVVPAERVLRSRSLAASP